MKLFYYIGAMLSTVVTLWMIIIACNCIIASEISEVFNGQMLIGLIILGVDYALGFIITLVLVYSIGRFISNKLLLFLASATLFGTIYILFEHWFYNRFSANAFVVILWFLNFAVSYAFIMLARKDA